MTEAQATEMIAQLTQLNEAVAWCYFLLEAIAWTTGIGAGLIMAICFIRALITKNVIT